MNQWTIKKLLDWMVPYLQEKNIEAPRLTAEMLISFALGMKRIELYMHFDKVLEPDTLSTLRELVKRCAENEPVQYIVGSCEFYSLTLKVSPECLIPRPETELLVARAIEFLRTRKNAQTVCDLCTGSGCIAVAIAKNFKNAKIFATDICDKALTIAAENVNRYNLADKIELLCGDLFEPVIRQIDAEQFDLITANPPYVTTEQMKQLDDNVKKYEPNIALHGGDDGLDIYRRIIDQTDANLKPGGALIMEIGYTQGPDIKQLLQARNIFTEIKIEKDFNKNDRIVTAIKN